MTNTIEETIVEIPVDKLVGHPANTARRSEITNCDDILESIQEHGQREPGRVRAIDDGMFEILSGHRRATCCKYTGQSFRAVVVEEDDTEATRDLILSNIRLNLDPIERAELMRTAINNGFEIADTAVLFGVGESVVALSMALLNLPESLQKLVADGTLAVRYARSFVKFSEAVIASDRFAAEIRKNEHMREGLKPHIVAEGYKRHTRPVDKTTRHCLSVASGTHSRKFEIDDELDKKLQIVTLPVGPNKKLIPVAQNTILWDRLQKKALAAVKPTTDASESSPKGKPDEKTSAAEKQESEKAADRSLEIYIDRFCVTLLRACIATKAVEDDENLFVSEVTPALVGHIGRDAPDWLEMCFQSLHELEADASARVVNHLRFAHSFGWDYVARLFVLLVYPSAETGIEQFRPIVPEGVPKNLVLSDPEFDPLWLWFADRMHITPEECWEATTVATHPASSLFARLIGAHNPRQRARLAKQWGMENAEKVSKADIIEAQMAGKPFPILERLSKINAGQPV